MLRSPIQRILASIGIASLYVAAAKFGFTMAFVAEQVTVVWPPTGIALAAVALAGYGVWPGVFAGAFIANITSHEPAATAAAIAAGNTLEAVLAVYFLQRFVGFKPALSRIRDVVGLIVVSAIFSTAVSATIGVTSLCISGLQSWSKFGGLWLVWWLGDGLGALIAGSLILTLIAGVPFIRKLSFEFVLLSASLVAAGLAVFSGLGTMEASHPLEYIVFPFVIWAALRFGPPGAAMTTFLSSAVALFGTTSGFGPFASGTADENLIFLQMFMAAVSVTGLILAAAIAETREKHALLHAVTEGTTDTVFVKDASGRYLMMNSAGARFIGKPVSDVVGKNDFELFSADTAAKIVERDRQVMEESSTATTEEIATAKGVTRTYLSTKGPYRDRDGQIIGVIGVSRDVTEQKEVREALRYSEERYRSLVLATSQVVWHANTKGDAVGELPTWTAFTGQSKEDLQDRGWVRMLYPDDVQRVTQIWEESIRTGNPHETEFRLLSADGSYKHVQSRAVPVLETDGTIREWIGTLTDITEKKKTEQERLELYRRADQNNRLKDEFLAMLAHELRNPLSAICTGLEILRIAKEETIRTRTREIIDRQVNHLTRLTDDLLDVSRVTRGKIELRTAPMDLRNVVHSSVDAVRSSIESRQHRLSVHVPDESLMVKGDPTRLEQVVTNLLQNAAKYTNPRGSIEVHLKRHDDMALLSVKDDGIGISNELLPRVFELFTQADRSLARSEGGLGIGLTIAQNLVEMHGGTVEAFSAGLGKGSEFLVRLPLAPALPTANHETKPAIHSRKELRIMVVDDNLDAAEVLASMLTLDGHTVRACNSGPEALERMSEFKPNVFLLDIGLPTMDGYEVASRIRQRDPYRSIRLIAISGYSQPADRLRATEAGFDHYLIKPVNPDVLTLLLQSGTESTADPKYSRGMQG